MASPPSDTSSADQPLVQPRKWTTKVNIAIVIAVVIVFVIGAIVAWRAWSHTKDAPPVHDAEPVTFLVPELPLAAPPTPSVT